MAKKAQKKENLGSGNHPNSQANLKPFSSSYQPKVAGRKKGSRNRATVFKRLLAIKIQIPDPADQAKMLDVTLHEAAAMGQIEAAMNGNPSAYRVIEEALFGKLTEKVEHAVSFTQAEIDELPDEELEQLAQGIVPERLAGHVGEREDD